MAVVISEIVTEVVLTPEATDQQAPATESEDAMDVIVRRATERVVELLRREWDR